MKILLAGCGKIGLALAEKLKQQHDFVGLKRSEVDIDFPIFTADLADAKTLTDLPSDFDIIIYTATPDSHDEAGYRHAMYTGIKNLLARFSGKSPTFIFISSTGVYGQDNGEWVDEGSPTEPSRFSGKVLVESEQLLLNSEINSLILRLSGIYSDKRLALFNRVLQGVSTGKDFPSWSNRVHFDDVIACLTFMLNKIKQGEHLEQIYNVTDCQPVSHWDVYNYIANACHSPLPTDSKTTKASGKKVTNKKLLALGYQFIHPDYKSGYQQAIEHYLQSK